MKIAVFSYLPPTFSGIAYHTENLYKYFKNDEIHLITFRKCERVNYMKIHRFKTVSNWIYSTDAITKINDVMKLLKKINPDIIHFHHNTSSIELGIGLMKYTLKKKIVNTIHVSPGGYYGPFRGIYFSLLAKELNVYSNGIISVSEFIKNKLREEGVNKRIEVIYNGVNLNEFRVTPIKHDKIWIMFAGRHIIGKGLGTLIKSMKKIDAELIVSGEGPMTNYYKSISNKNIKFLGKLKRNDYIKYLVSSDIVVIPSIINEANSIVAMEAMAAKKPIIVSNSGALPELVKNGGGIIFEKGNYKELREAIFNLMNDKKKMNRLGKLNYKFIKNWTWKKVANRTRKFYKKILDGPARI